MLKWGSTNTNGLMIILSYMHTWGQVWFLERGNVIKIAFYDIHGARHEFLNVELATLGEEITMEHRSLKSQNN